MTVRTRRRVVTTVLAPATALMTWACIRLAGVDLVVSAGNASVGPVDVIAAALTGAAGGWLVVRALERYSRRPALWWPPVASSALAISTIGPSHLAHGASAAALVVLHFVTAIVVITGFATTLPGRGDCCPRWMRRCAASSDPAP